MTILLLAILFGAPIAYLLYHTLTAPMGYEDQNGFHYGKPGGTK